MTDATPDKPSLTWSSNAFVRLDFTIREVDRLYREIESYYPGENANAALVGARHALENAKTALSIALGDDAYECEKLTRD